MDLNGSSSSSTTVPANYFISANSSVNEVAMESSLGFYDLPVTSSVMSSSPSDGAPIGSSLLSSESFSSPPWREWVLPTTTAFSPPPSIPTHVSLSTATNSFDDLLDPSRPSPTPAVAATADPRSYLTPSYFDTIVDLASTANTPSEWLLIVPTPQHGINDTGLATEHLNFSSPDPYDAALVSLDFEIDSLPFNFSADNFSMMDAGCKVLNNGTALCWAAASDLTTQMSSYFLVRTTTTANGSEYAGEGTVSTIPEVTQHPVIKEYWALVLLLFPLFTVFGNVLVILSVYKERSLHTVTNYFIVSLAVADLLVAALVMPFAVYFLVNVNWELSPTVCDFYIAMDVACSTSSIFNLVAISIDRFIAVTQPIKYAKHRNNKRVFFTIAIVWLVSAAIASPIVLGLNTSPNRNPSQCIFYNPDFIIYSSLSSFYIPCIIMIVLYYKIFKAIHERAKKSAAGRRGAKPNKQSGSDIPGHTDVVIENIAQTKRHRFKTPFFERGRGPFFRYKETVVTLCVPVEGDHPTANTESGSQENGDEDGELDELALSNTEHCHVIQNDSSGLDYPRKGATLGSAQPLNQLESPTSQLHPSPSNMHLSPSSGTRSSGILTNGSNHDASYECSEVTTEETTFLSGDSCSGAKMAAEKCVKEDEVTRKPLERRTSEAASRRSSQHHGKSSKRNGSIDVGAMTNDNNGSWNSSTRESERRANYQGDGGVVSSSGGGRKPRFHITRHHKSSRKKKEKSAAKKERKATKTLAIVIGVFLACWVPFFTCNILDAICIKLGSHWSPGIVVFMLTTWLGYMNSFINPVIYTIFNPEFRKAFKKILSGG